MNVEQEQQTSSLTIVQLFRFFLPLGFSVFLVSLSHVIIQSTLTRAANPEFVIATFAIAMSILPIFERPGILVRQTCSILVKDRISYIAMRNITLYVLCISVGISMVFAYTPTGEWVFRHILGVNQERIHAVTSIFQILMYIVVFSGIRLFYHGIIISHLQTKWLTIAMLVRILGMYVLSIYFIQTDQVSSGHIGAYIFLLGMMIECLICAWEGNRLVKKLPVKAHAHAITSKSQIFQFYRPLLLSSFLVIVIGPSINLMLGKTTHMELAIASFAIAQSLTNLLNSFFYYIHQVIMQFHRVNARKVQRFLGLIGLFPTVLMVIFSFTAVGPWFMQEIMGVNEALLAASMNTLRIFIIFCLIYPLLDACNGLIMLYNQNKFLVWSQGANVVVTLLTLCICLFVTREWNGTLGALALSLGLIGELSVVLYIIKRNISHVKFQ